MKKMLTPLIIILVIAGLGYFGFTKFKSGDLFQGNVEQYTNADKQGVTTKTGKITTNQGKFFLREEGEIPELIDSMTVELEPYVGQTVTVEGKYSGEILFVGAIK